MSQKYSKVPAPPDDNILFDQDATVTDVPESNQTNGFGNTETPLIAHEATNAPRSDDTKSHMFQVDFYRSYFDLDTDTFFKKIKTAMNPFATQGNVDGLNGAPTFELYGFIWITSSLVLLMFISSTGATLLAQWLYSSKEKYEYDFSQLTFSVAVFYGYNIIVPGVLFAITTWLLKFPHRLSLPTVISIYGYTNVLWFPITIINVIVAVIINKNKHRVFLNVVEWIIVLVSGLITGFSNLRQLSPILLRNCLSIKDVKPEVNPRRLHIIILSSLALIHLVFSVIVKISCFGVRA